MTKPYLLKIIAILIYSISLSYYCQAQDFALNGDAQKNPIQLASNDSKQIKSTKQKLGKI